MIKTATAKRMFNVERNSYGDVKRISEVHQIATRQAGVSRRSLKNAETEGSQPQPWWVFAETRITV